MDQREIVGQVVLVPSHPLCHLTTDLLMKIVGLGVLANQEGQLNIWTLFEELRMPLFRKALARWQVTLFSMPWEIKVHRNDRKYTRMVEGLFIDS